MRNYTQLKRFIGKILHCLPIPRGDAIDFVVCDFTPHFISLGGFRQMQVSVSAPAEPLDWPCPSLTFNFLASLQTTNIFTFTFLRAPEGATIIAKRISHFSLSSS
jgi:hypothetical protein